MNFFICTRPQKLLLMQIHLYFTYELIRYGSQPSFINLSHDDIFRIFVEGDTFDSSNERSAASYMYS